MGMREMANDSTRRVKGERVSPEGIDRPTAWPKRRVLLGLGYEIALTRGQESFHKDTSRCCLPVLYENLHLNMGVWYNYHHQNETRRQRLLWWV